MALSVGYLLHQQYSVQNGQGTIMSHICKGDSDLKYHICVVKVAIAKTVLLAFVISG